MDSTVGPMGSANTDRFRELMSAAPNGFALDEACLVIAAHARPGLDVDHYLSVLDDLAGGILPPTLDGLLGHLFAPGGFVGNREDYYDPQNSFLDRVLERRTGLPITLAVLAMEVGRRAGVPLWGVSMPGHFLLRDKVDPTVFVDPFNGGQLLTALECRRMHHAMSGGAPWEDAFLNPVSRLSIVARVLSNLKGIAQQRQDLGMLLWVLTLRQAVPGLGEQELAELQQVRARLN